VDVQKEVSIVIVIVLFGENVAYAGVNQYEFDREQDQIEEIDAIVRIEEIDAIVRIEEIDVNVQIEEIDVIAQIEEIGAIVRIEEIGAIVISKE